MYLAYCFSGPNDPTDPLHGENAGGFSTEPRPRAMVPLAELYPDVFAIRKETGPASLLKTLARLLRSVF